ncbi:MAG TPA: hypothetical protein VK604_14935 [Bryobacteraceae bacterium]|nr:hypothetical protein [Bryobacteraceae bacterium]HTF72556.1 hypothetical protein [Edaphobacter sp.]
MKNGEELKVTIGTRLTESEAAEWAEYTRRNESRSSLLLRELIRSELDNWKFRSPVVRERVAAEQLRELFAETMAMTLEGEDLERFMAIVRRVAPDSEFVKRSNEEPEESDRG